MKRTTIILSMLLAVLCSISAQVLTTADAAMVYYMPKTILAFDVEYVEMVRTQGPFYQYAERYLGTKEVVTEDETRYELKGITLHTKTVADKTRAYKFTPTRAQRACLTLDSKGLLAAYNAQLPQPAPTKRTPTATTVKEETHNRPALPPYSEETLLATSKAKMAESTAKQIYRIREARINLLAGEVEHIPADGKALELTLNELQKQEDQLTALFTGTVVTKRQHKTILLAPESDAKDSVLLRFSRFAGPVAADDLSGEVVLLTIETKRQTLAEVADDKKPAARSEIYYNLPGEAAVTLVDAQGALLLQQTLPIAQFGVSVALPVELINRKPQIIFNTRTGEIQSITE